MAPLVNCFLISCKDFDQTIRASGLSNVAEICKILRYGLHPYVVEIIECVESLLRFDKESEVRRGGIYVLYLLLEGLGVEAFQFMPEYLGKIGRLVNEALHDPDAVTRYHAQQTKAYLSEIVGDFLSPPVTKSPFHIL